MRGRRRRLRVSPPAEGAGNPPSLAVTFPLRSLRTARTVHCVAYPKPRQLDPPGDTHMKTRTLTPLFVALALAACGGYGEDASSEAADASAEPAMSADE